MIFSNPIAIILLGIVFGASVSVLFVGAESYLLSVTQPIVAVYSGVAAGVAFWLFLKFFRLRRLKFAAFSFLATAIYCLALVSLHFCPEFYRAILGFFLAIFSIRFFKWVTSEMALKHLPPSIAQEHFSYLITTYEIGMLSALIGMKLYPPGLNPDQILSIAACLGFATLPFIAFQFFPKRNFEIHFTRKVVAPPPIRATLFQSLLMTFAVMSLCFGAFKVCEEYLIKIVLKEHLVSYSAIRDLLTDYRLIGNVAIILLGFGFGGFVRRKHLSPVRILYFQSCLLITVGTVCVVTRSFYSFVAFDVARWVGEHGLFFLSSQMVLSSFVDPFRSKLRSAQSLFYYPLAGISLLVLFSLAQRAIPLHQKGLLLILIMVFLFLGLGLIVRFRSLLEATLYEFIASAHKSAAIHAISMLSFLRPTNFEEEMGKLLSLSPKKLLRKNIILSLGYSQNPASINTIIQEFNTDKEEIQIAVEEALQVSHRYKAIQFINKIMLGQVRTKSIRVRMNATATIASMYGKRSIPFLIGGLDDQDTRMVANILETLSAFKDKNLISYFEEFVNSPIPRVRANALMGLAAFRKTRENFRKSIRSMLTGSDKKMVASALYALGKLKEKGFQKDLERIFHSPLAEEEDVKRCLAWALIRTKEKLGIDMFGELFSLVPREKEETNEALMHFFSQLSRETRLSLIRKTVLAYRKEPAIIDGIECKLRHPVYDFHEEIDYLHLLKSQF